MGPRSESDQRRSTSRCSARRFNTEGRRNVSAEAHRERQRPRRITGIWLHPYEEETAPTSVFRPRLRLPGGPLAGRIPGRWEDLGNGRAQIAVITAAGSPFPLPFVFAGTRPPPEQ
jgi:hypothetical protein